MLDSRTASHVLELIASYLELKGENSFKCRAYASAAEGIRGLNTDDLESLYRSGQLAAVRGVGPATLAVVRDLLDTGESHYLEQLRETLPEGLVQMLEVPGLTPPRIRAIHETLSLDTMEALEAAAKDGRLATVPKIGPKTSAKILKGIATARERGTLRLYHHATNEARPLLEAVRAHPDVMHAELAGALRRRAEIVDRIDIVAVCRANPVAVAQSFGRIPGVQDAEGSGASITVRFVDGARMNLHCVEADSFGAALWRATGNDQHVAQVVARLVARRVSLQGSAFVESNGNVIPAGDESGVYRAAGLAFIEPELREGLGEVEAAASGDLPRLVTSADVRGVLHCHTHYSDGKASVVEMARAARARGWSYIGITDHSQAAAFAGGMSRDQILAQHEEIDMLNAAEPDFRILKGVEADILADGRLDYGDELLDTFDFVIGSVHSRFAMDGAAMTERILRAMADPRLTILGHPTGRKLLAREPYGLDVDAMLEKAAALGIAVELNADPRRLDLDWRHLRKAKALGVTVEIGPDAHSANALDNLEVGVGIARKAWLTPADVLNTRSADDIIAFARARHDRH